MPALTALTNGDERVVVAVELSRLLRRGLLVAGIAAAGWLLSVAFAGTASADKLPDEDTQVHRNGGLIGGLTGTLGDLTTGLTGLTESVVDTAGDLLSPNVTPPAEPIVDLPSLLPTDGSAIGGGSSSSSGSGSATTDRVDVPRVEAAPAPEAPVVAPPPAAPEIAPAAPVAAPPVVPNPVTQVIPAVQDSSDATDHAGQRGSHPRPVKTPAAPAGSGTTVSTTHDSSGGARGTHGVLISQATLHPADAGFTTRSRAVDAAGRTAGLPASSPD